MRAKNFVLVFSLIILFITVESFTYKKVQGEGPVVSETRELSGFDGISISIPAQVFLYQGTEEKIVIEAQQNVLDIIKTEVAKDVLRMAWVLPDKLELSQFETIKVSIYSPHFNTISVLGSSDVFNKTPLKADDIDINIMGSGDVTIDNLVATSVDLKISGSGNTNITGSCDDQNIKIAGSGKISNENLLTKSTNVNVSGSGSARVNADDYLNAKILGSGNVYYKGNPEVESSIAGSGKVSLLK